MPEILNSPAFVHHALNRNLTDFLLVAAMKKFLSMSYQGMVIMK